MIRRLFGPPGTGKTTTMSRLIAEAATRYAGRVGVTSFTKTAALELRGRDLPLSLDRVGTLHSMAFRALGSPKILEKDREARAAWNEEAPAGWEIQSGAVSIDDPFEERSVAEDGDALSEYHRARHRLRAESSPEAKRYELWKRAHDVADFTDLIGRCLEDKIPPPIEAAIWYHDETQDSTPLELALLRSWASSCRGGLVLAGDDQQALYGFRGATPDAFLAGEAEEEVLGQSYRLPEEIRRFAHDYGCAMELHRPKEWRGQDRYGAVEQVSVGLDRPEEVLDVVQRELTEEGSATVMLLATCGYMLRPILKALRDAGIPFENPYRPTRADWNPTRTGGPRRLWNFLREDATWRDAWAWIEMLDARACGMTRGAKKMLRDEIFGEDESFGRCRFDARDFAAIACENLPEDLSPEWLVEHSLPKFAAMLDYPLRIRERHGNRALVDAPRVRVGTIHSVKGGEADSVILFPDVSRRAWSQRDSDPDDLRRTFYVGMTRARRRLLLAQRASRYFEAL